MFSMKATVSSDLTGWIKDEEREDDVTALTMAVDIHRRSAILAPKDSRNLVNSGRVERVARGHYRIVYGGNGNGFSVPYAKRRHFENRLNPQTLGYLAVAGDTVARSGVAKYRRRTW